MNATTIRRVRLVGLLVFSLPILLHLYNPSMQLGGFGLLLGMIGYIVSPILLFATMITEIVRKW